MRTGPLLRCVFLAFLGAACSSKEPPSAPQSPRPAIIRLQPLELEVSPDDQNLDVIGQGFVSGLAPSEVRWNGTRLPTLYLGDSLLRATVPAAVLSTGPTIGNISVYTPPPGGGLSGVIAVGVRFPTPLIASVTPVTGDFGLVTPFSVVMTGRGFFASSVVTINGNQLPTTYESFTSIRASVPPEFVPVLGSYALRVVNPPAGGPSLPFPYPVQYGVPAITAFDHASVSAGQPYELLVLGSKFTRQSVVRWNGSPRQTRFENDTRIWAWLTFDDLVEGTVGQVTVANPSPGGGTSLPRSLPVLAIPPVVLTVDPGSVVQGSGPRTVTIRGFHFTPQIDVVWNGNNPPSQFVSPNVITVTGTAQDFATPRRIDINLAGGAGTATLRVYGAASGITSHRSVALAANQGLWDPLRQLVYISTPSWVTDFGDRVVALDPVTGDVVWSLRVGAEPYGLAITDDGKYLYVGFESLSIMKRIDLATQTIDLTFPLTAQHCCVIAPQVSRLRAVPGQNRLVVVLHKNGDVGVYDEGQPRLAYVQLIPQITDFATAVQFYAYDGTFLRTLAVTAAGVVETAPPDNGGIRIVSGAIIYHAGRLFIADGTVFNAPPAGELYRFGATGVPIPDLANNRVHFELESTISTMDATTRALVSVTDIYPATMFGAAFRWGTDGLGFVGVLGVVFIRGPLIKP